MSTQSTLSFRRDCHDHDHDGRRLRRDRSYSDAHAVLFSKKSSASNYPNSLDLTMDTDCETATMTGTAGQSVVGGKLLHHQSSPSSPPNHHHNGHAGRPRSKSLDVHRCHHVAPSMHKKKYPNHHHHRVIMSRAHQQQHGWNSPDTASNTTATAITKLKGKMWIRPASPIRRPEQQQPPPHPHPLFQGEVEENGAGRHHAILTHDNNTMMLSSPVRQVADFPHSLSNPPYTADSFEEEEDELLLYSTTSTLPKISFTSSTSSSSPSSPYGDVDLYPTTTTTTSNSRSIGTSASSGPLKLFSFGESGKPLKPREFHLINTMRT